MSYIPNPLCPCVEYVPDPLVLTPPSDPCVTEAQRLGRQTQRLNCLDVPVDPPSDPLTSLLAYWKMEEGAGTRQDSHTGNLDLSDRAATQNIDGKIGNAAYFIAYPDGLNSTSAAFAPGTNSFTIAGWVRLQGLIDTVILGKASPGPDGYRLSFNTASSMFVFSTYRNAGATSTISSAITISDNVWYYVACGYESGTARIFFSTNGAAKTYTTAIGGSQTDSPNPFTVGYDSGGGDLSGRVDELGVWFNRVLSDADIAWLYNSGTGRTYPFS